MEGASNPSSPGFTIIIDTNILIFQKNVKNLINGKLISVVFRIFEAI